MRVATLYAVIGHFVYLHNYYSYVCVTCFRATGTRNVSLLSQSYVARTSGEYL